MNQQEPILTTETKKKRKTDTSRSSTILLMLLLVVLILIGGVYLIRDRYQLCEEECEYVFDKDLESSADELGIFVTKDVSSRTNTSASLRIKGSMHKVDVTNDTYVVIFRNFFEQSTINKSIPEFRVTIDAKRCSGTCEETLLTLKKETEENWYNRITTLEIDYSIIDNELPLSQRLSFAFAKVIAGFTDKKVDASTFASMNINVTAISPDDMKTACVANVDQVSMTELAEKMYNGVFSVIGRADVYDSDARDLDIVDRAIRYGSFHCNSCTKDCTIVSAGTGLDYIFIPLLVSYLREQGSEVNPSESLEILARSYGSSSLDSFATYVDSTEGWLAKGTNFKWGTDSVCFPYYSAEKLGQVDGDFYQVAKKLCEDRAFNTWYGNTDARLFEPFIKFSEEATLDGLNLLLENKSAFQASDLAQDQTANDGFLIRSMDDYVYGYEQNDTTFVAYGNQGLTLALWYFVNVYEERGAIRSTTNQNLYRDLLLTLLLKKELTTDIQVKDSTNEIITKLIAFAGGNETVTKAFDMSITDSSPRIDDNDRSRRSLGDLLKLWLTNSDFYNEYFERSWQEYAQDWFYSSYQSEECGKADKGFFLGMDSDGRCLKGYVNIRENFTSMLYLLMLTSGE